MNGVSLLGMDNARAIQVLREAMMKDGRVHGFIGITVSRPRNTANAAASSAAQSSSQCREVRVSQADHEDLIDGGTVSTLPPPRRTSPVQRLTAVGVPNNDASPLSVSLPADIAQV